jgi:LPXTG-site transpeptidase (sortase) family protein
MSWRVLVSLFGTLLTAVGLGGFALLMAMPRLPVAIVEPVAAIVTGEVPRMPDVAASQVIPRVEPAADAASYLPITRLVIPGIDLDTAVAPAPLVEHAGTTTWDVPKFVAGHAEGTPGAGEPGNAIVIGHVTSVTLGNVFEHLDQVHAGDRVSVFSAQREFEYRVSSVRSVSRSDVSVLERTETPALTLITCTGLWLPTVWDYTERLVVRAELSQNTR